jgi:thiamine-monophosphate kinase
VTVSDLTERELIARIQRRLPPSPSWMPVGIGDDAAVVEPVRNHLDVLTVDAIVDGVHFDRRFSPPEAIGHRALAVNLSDLAAMGASPRLALLSLALPADLSVDHFERMIDGLARLALTHHLHVAGGNLTRTPGPLTLDVTAIGSAKRRQVLTRSGARAGDEIYVTGSLGAAAAGLYVLQSKTPASAGDMADCVERYFYPIPRVRAGVLVGRNRAASACMDLSDGLADGVRQISAASQVGMIVDANALPLDAAARGWFEIHGHDPVSSIVAAGDDYELMITASPKLRRRLRAAAQTAGIALTKIGVCTKEPELILQREGVAIAAGGSFPEGFRHFR